MIFGSLVPGFSDGLKYAVMAGGKRRAAGMTVIANAPNPAGQSILQGQLEETDFADEAFDFGDPCRR